MTPDQVRAELSDEDIETMQQAHAILLRIVVGYRNRIRPSGIAELRNASAVLQMYSDREWFAL